MVKVIEPIIEKAAKEAAAQAEENTQFRIAKSMLRDGMDGGVVVRYTGLDVKQVEALKSEVAL